MIDFSLTDIVMEEEILLQQFLELQGIGGFWDPLDKVANDPI